MIRHYGCIIYTPSQKGTAQRKEWDMSPQILELNPRANAVTFTPEEVIEVADMLGDVRHGEAVALDAVDSEGKARARARLMKELLKDEHDLDVRGHMIQDGEGDNAKFYPAVSLRKVKPGTPEVAAEEDAPKTPKK